jgi:hypothetical protein
MPPSGVHDDLSRRPAWVVAAPIDQADWARRLDPDRRFRNGASQAIAVPSGHASRCCSGFATDSSRPVGWRLDGSDTRSGETRVGGDCHACPGLVGLLGKRAGEVGECRKRNSTGGVEDAFDPRQQAGPHGGRAPQVVAVPGPRPGR